MINLTVQEVYNKIRKHLLTQNAAAMKFMPQLKRDGCAYRGDGGTMCAVGCLIDDKHYTSALENRVWDTVEVWDALKASGVPLGEHEYPAPGYETEEPMHRLLSCAQSIHDRTPPNSWEDRLDYLAKNLNLKVMD